MEVGCAVRMICQCVLGRQFYKIKLYLSEKKIYITAVLNLNLMHFNTGRKSR